MSNILEHDDLKSLLSTDEEKAAALEIAAEKAVEPPKFTEVKATPPKPVAKEPEPIAYPRRDDFLKPILPAKPIPPTQEQKELPTEEIEFEPAPNKAEKTPMLPKTKHKLKVALTFFVIFILVFIITYVAINFASFKTIALFHYQAVAKQTPPIAATKPPLDPTGTARLVIPKLNVNAPIAWNTPETELDNKMLSGVAHYSGTALPGQGGNTFITGHSSYYSWVKSDYKDVFALLDKLKAGDIIYIQYENATYTYTVTSSQVVSPDHVEVLNSNGQAIVSLMTCVPVGTNLRRLVVIADQTDATGLF